MLTRRTPPTKKKKVDSDDRSTDNLESGGASSSSDDDNFTDEIASKDTSTKSAPHGKYSANEKQGMLVTLFYGSLLYIGYRLDIMLRPKQLGLMSQQRDHSISSPSLRNSIISSPKSKSIRVPASTKWLFKPPPKLKDMYNARNCESYLAEYNETGESIDSKSLKIYTEEEWAYFRQVWRSQGKWSYYVCMRWSAS